MFDLEQSIAAWRRQMLAAGVKNPNDLDELESHLREEVKRQTRLGASTKRAFEVATECIGQPAALQCEFAKAAAEKGTFWRKWRDALLRFIGVPPSSPATFTTGAREILELGRMEALGFHHDFIGTEHVVAGVDSR